MFYCVYGQMSEIKNYYYYYYYYLKMLRLLKLGLSEYAENHVFGSYNLNISEKHRLSFEDIFLGTLVTYMKKK